MCEGLLRNYAHLRHACLLFLTVTTVDLPWARNIIWEGGGGEWKPLPFSSESYLETLPWNMAFQVPTSTYQLRYLVQLQWLFKELHEQEVVCFHKDSLHFMESLQFNHWLQELLMEQRPSDGNSATSYDPRQRERHHSMMSGGPWTGQGEVEVVGGSKPEFY